MFRTEPSGKLIISRSNNYYETFHALNFILVKYNKNRINIAHRIKTLVINGNKNDIEIGLSGSVDKIVINGDNNTILVKNLYSLNNVINNGEGNNLYEKGKENNDEALDSQEEEEEDEENEEKEEDEYENDYEEEKDDINKYRLFNAKRTGRLSSDNRDRESEEKNEDDNDEDDDDNMFAVYGNDIDYYTLLEIDSQLKMQLRREREKELFHSSLVNMFFNSPYSKGSEIKTEDISSDLVDICYKKVSKGVKEGNEKCVICYENFKENEKVKMTGCFHIFHFNCIKKWIESKEDMEESPDCPICRRSL